jgi:coenzyme F420 hydrogenase subunit delta
VAEPHSDFEYLPAFCRARILILGVGNVLFGDDGFGPAVANHLSEHYSTNDEIYIMDVGTGVRKLLFTLTLSESLPEEIIIIDAVDWGYAVGSISCITPEELPLNKIDDFSLHQVPTSNMLRELHEQLGIKVTILACDVGEIPQ